MKHSTLTITPPFNSELDLPTLAETSFGTFCIYKGKLVLVTDSGLVEMDSGKFIYGTEFDWNDKCTPVEAHLTYKAAE